MALQFTVVRRKDMRKNAAADSKLFYGQTKASMKMDFDKFCEAVGDYCTASSADVKAVLGCHHPYSGLQTGRRLCGSTSGSGEFSDAGRQRGR